MIPALLVVFVILVGLGFVKPILWLAAAALIYGIIRYCRRDRPWRRDDPEYVEYRRSRTQRDRYERRYDADRRSFWRP
ncbi:hypothetical protein [Streptomyces sp. NPDC050264]|uniref:hypothetical protein n=1 Tax=Streptomyces sp. NPDC050264 TaxID=3155038 RepID=UPI00343D2FF5